MTDDDVIIDVAGQALDIFSTVQSVHKNGMVKTFTHTSIPIHPCTLLKQSKTLNSPNIMPSFPCRLPVQCGRRRRSGSLADAPQHCSTSEAFSPRTVLTENIGRCAQQIFQHRPSTMPFVTTSTITLSCRLHQLTRLTPGDSDTW